MAEIVWRKAVDESSIPHGRRLLLIVTPKNLPQADPLPDVVVGHWNESQWAFVPVEVPSERQGVRPHLKVLLWAEIPEPDGVELRPLAAEDLVG